jgi:protoporphyrin/coproporphyrin ferrochelatase
MQPALNIPRPYSETGERILEMKLDKDCGVLLINMGGPSGPEGVKPFLREMFSDRFLMPVPLGALLQKPLAKFIARRRAGSAAEHYAAIGGKSPLLEETAKQAAGLEKLLSAPVIFSMRYTRPRADEAVKLLKTRGASRVVVVPLYPQYCLATTGSAIADFRARTQGAMPATIVESHFNHAGFISTLFELLGNALKQSYPGLKTHVLFAAHSIPQSFTRRGDPYVSQVEQTVKTLASRLKIGATSSLAFQSRLGPVKWQGPSLEQELLSLRAQEVEQLVVQPVSFVSENLETLYDLDIKFNQKCRSSGIKNFIRVPCPSDSDKYLQTLAELVASAAAGGKWEGRSA